MCVYIVHQPINGKLVFSFFSFFLCLMFDMYIVYIPRYSIWVKVTCLFSLLLDSYILFYTLTHTHPQTRSFPVILLLCVCVLLLYVDIYFIVRILIYKRQTRKLLAHLLAKEYLHKVLKRRLKCRQIEGIKYRSSL